jgi:hypothetical protein
MESSGARPGDGRAGCAPFCLESLTAGRKVNYQNQLSPIAPEHSLAALDGLGTVIRGNLGCSSAGLMACADFPASRL